MLFEGCKLHPIVLPPLVVARDQTPHRRNNEKLLLVHPLYQCTQLYTLGQFLYLGINLLNTQQGVGSGTEYRFCIVFIAREQAGGFKSPVLISSAWVIIFQLILQLLLFTNMQICFLQRLKLEPQVIFLFFILPGTGTCLLQRFLGSSEILHRLPGIFLSL